MSNIEKNENNSLSVINDTTESLTHENRIKLTQLGLKSVNIGDWYFNENLIIKINEIIRTGDKIEIKLARSKDFGKTFETWGSETLERFLQQYGEILQSHTTSPNSVLDIAKQVLSGEISLESFAPVDEENNSSLMHMGSKDTYIAIRDSLIEKRRQASAIASAIKYEMEVQRRKLDIVRQELNEFVTVFKKQVERIEKVIWTIELYLGLKEDIVQIQDGNHADEDQPICFHQEVLCMDEEVGDPDDDGIDFSRIQDFDSWLCKYNTYYKMYNYELVNAEQKSVVAFKVRRESKHYSDNPFINSLMNEENHKTYILIRNGEQLFRIWTEIDIFPRMFPHKVELQQLIDEQYDLSESIETGDYAFYREKYKDILGSFFTTESKKRMEMLDAKIFRYQQQFIMMQGLIDRTTMFQPHASDLKITDSQAIESGKIKLIYDNENRLGDNRLTYTEWRNKVNEHVGIGSRIFLHASWRNEDTSQFAERFDKRYQDGRWYQGKTYYDLPQSPNSGLYHLESYKTEEWDRHKKVATCFEDFPEYAIYNEFANFSDYKKDSDGKYSKDEENLRIRNVRTDKSAWEFKSSILDKYGNFDKSKISYPYWYDECDPETWKPLGNYSYWKEHAVIKYLPGAEPDGSYKYYWDERKNRVSFKIYTDSDTNFINFDGIDIEELEFYLFDRRHRKGYLSMMKVLHGLYKLLLEEKAWEVDFKLMLKGELLAKPDWIDKSTIDWFIDDAINWWKTKNKWKRSIASDDHKATRMIRKKLWLPV